MEGQWTYSDLEVEWVNDAYNSKEEAIKDAKKVYEKGCIVGQLEHDKGTAYAVVKQEEITF